MEEERRKEERRRGGGGGEPPNDVIRTESSELSESCLTKLYYFVSHLGSNTRGF